MDRRIETHGSGALRVLCGAVLLSLAACSAKPPDCADSQTVALAGRIVQDEIRERFAAEVKKQPEDVRPTLKELLDTYVNAMKIGVINIVSNGYSSDAKRFSCEGKFTVGSPTGKELSLQTPYTTQLTQDKAATFLVRIERFGALESDLADDFMTFVDAEMARRAAAQQAPAASTSTPPADAAAGTQISYRKEDATARLTLQGKELQFKLLSALDGFTCELQGVAKQENPTSATYTGPDAGDPCSARFETTGDLLTVTTEGCSSACGMRAHGSMDGTYKRTAEK